MLQPTDIPPIPAETARVARAAFPKGNLYLRIADEFGNVYTDATFRDLFPSHGQPAAAAWRLALTTIFQFAEGLTDRQAADAVRSRLDWKYALRLELTDTGFDHTVLREFRTRLVAGDAARLLLQTLLTRLREHGLLKARGRQRTDSTHVLAAVRQMNRLECVGETLRAALNDLAVVVPDWLQTIALPEWWERYAVRFENFRLPSAEAARTALAATIGADGFHLLAAVYTESAPAVARSIPTVQTLRQVWLQQYYGPHAPVIWRAIADLPPSALLIHSPYDDESRYSTKRSIEWVGDKAHVTETCEDDAPHLIVHVETTASTTLDMHALDAIHTNLAASDLLPSEHFVDSGYVAAEDSVTSHDTHAVTLVGPAHADPSWQAKADTGFDVAHFVIDWEAKTVQCPQGKLSHKWDDGVDNVGHPATRVRFGRKDCVACPMRVRCTRSPDQPRELTLRPQQLHMALQDNRAAHRTKEWQKRYARRAGVEGTFAQGTRLCDLRHARYIGQAKTHLQHVLTATALNLIRVNAWLTETPFAATRRSRFAALCPRPAALVDRLTSPPVSMLRWSIRKHENPLRGLHMVVLCCWHSGRC